MSLDPVYFYRTPLFGSCGWQLECVEEREASTQRAADGKKGGSENAEDGLDLNYGYKITMD